MQIAKSPTRCGASKCVCKPAEQRSPHAANTPHSETDYECRNSSGWRRFESWRYLHNRPDVNGRPTNNAVDAAWTFAYYPIQAPTSPNGGWVGLSEITYIGDGQFVVVERDNQAGTDARIMQLFSFSIAGIDFLATPDGSPSNTISKTFVRDLIPDLLSDNGSVIEKVEGFTVADGSGWNVTDNDGVDDSSGETQLIRLDDDDAE